MVQLRNMLNRCDIGYDISGRFNAAVDFFEMVTRCHIIAAAMSFFGMVNINSDPVDITLPCDIAKWPLNRQWPLF